MKLCIVFLSLLLTEVFSAVSFSFGGNVTVANPNQFAYRFVDTGAWSLGLFSGAWFISGSVDITKIENGGSVSFDLIEAACYTGTGSYPVVWLAYFDETASALRDLTSPNSTNWASVNVTEAGGFLGLAYFSIDEKDTNGNVVNSLLLNDVLWVTDKTATGCNADKSLCWVGYSGVSLNLLAPSTLRIQYIASRVIGKIGGFSDLVVSPRGLESIFYINTWTYQSQSNSLSLNMGIASKTVALAVDGTLSSSDSGNSRVYVGMAKTALVNNNPTSVTVGAAVYADINATFASVNSNLVAQVQAKYGKLATATLISVSFPPGATNIVYDPNMGSGTAPNSATSLGTSFFTLFVLLLALIIKQQ